MGQNHILNPLFFLPALNCFGFWYDWFSEGDIKINELGEKETSFVKRSIYGSLQSQGTGLNQKKEGNTEDMKYEFYCMSSNRIKIGDFLYYKNRWLYVTQCYDFDEFGVRHCTLEMVNLNNHKDLLETVKYLEGYLVV